MKLRFIGRLYDAGRQALLVQQRSLYGVPEGDEIQPRIRHSMHHHPRIGNARSQRRRVADSAIESHEFDGSRRSGERHIPAHVDSHRQAVVDAGLPAHETELLDPVARFAAGRLELIRK